MKIPANILVIEDDENLNKTLVKALGREGYQVKGALNGELALKMVEKNIFDVVISDVKLPGLTDGVEIVRQIKEKYSNRIISIMMTGYSDFDAPVRAIKTKVDEFIPKPFELQDLLDLISSNVKKIIESRGKSAFIEDKVKMIISRYFNIKKEKVGLKMSFSDDLGANIFDNVGLIMAVEEMFKIEIEDCEAEKMQTVRDLVSYLKELS